MRVTWYGQSAFALEGAEKTVFIDPFGDAAPVRKRGMQWDFPPIEGVSADLLLITHEHFDHNGADAISGDPVVIRSTAGRLESPVGEVVAVASEHDPQAGTSRGPNTIFRFELDGLAVCHFGDFGQLALRDEQAEAIGSVDMLFLPVGGGPTTDAEQAHAIAERLRPRWVVPMHYRTPQIGFLEPADAFLALREAGGVERLASPTFDTDALGDAATVVPAPPGAA
jgi:L-ascorbate metabolism protein UlaG (beta-lactamase superfamily)